MPNSRIPQTLAEFVAYLTATKPYMSAATFEPVSVTVAAATSQNLLAIENLPENMSITLANTGTVAVDPDLHFCMANDEDDSCDPLTAVTVAAGSSTTVTVAQLGGPGKHHLNVTNVHATNSSTCLVTFQPNWQRLGLLETVKQKWENDAGLILGKYQLAQNPLTLTKNLKEQLKTLPAAFRAFAQPVLKTIEGSVNIIDADYGIFNIAKRDTTPTARGPITGVPVNDIAALGGGTMRVKVRTSEDSSRASKHPLSDGVEVRYKIVSQSSGVNTPLPGAGTTDTTPPASPDDCPLTVTSTKANFKLVLGAAQSGKKIYGFTRWVNVKTPANNGEWSALFQAVIV